MALTLAAFKVKFPELQLDGSTESDAYLQQHLDDALLELSASVWGDKLDIGHGYLTAHNIASSPYGQSAKLDGYATTYEKHYRRIQRQVAGAWRVASRVTDATLYAAGDPSE